MASSLPIPLPPRTPSPLSDDASPHQEQTRGLGIASDMGDPPASRTRHNYHLHAGMGDLTNETPYPTITADSMLSPASATFPITNGGLSPQNSVHSPNITQTPNVEGGIHFSETGAQGRQPFNFVPQQYVAGRAIARQSSNDAIGRRKGHKYRHSSIHASAMESIVQAPLAHRKPLAVPAALPVPTRTEAWRAMSANQTARLSWCLCHFLVSAYVQFSGSGSLAMTALSRLLLFDAAGATVCVAVDVMGNFEVWKRSSIKHPFGLERIDVLAGFGMAVFIAFMGLDIISHGIQHSLENLGSHVPHTAHAHSRVTSGSVDIASLLAISSTLVSALLLKNHTRIGRAMRFELIAGWGKILGNPSHFLTLSCSLLVLVLPFLSEKTYKTVDFIFSIFIALLMITLGVRLGTSLSNMLLMSYTSPDNSVQHLINAIGQSSGVSSVEEARFWQVHYGLCMANVKLRSRSVMGGDDLASIRERVVRMIKSQFSDSKGVRWDITVQVGLESD
nr:putative zinc transporter zrg17 [Quercus suber]